MGKVYLHSNPKFNDTIDSCQFMFQLDSPSSLATIRELIDNVHPLAPNTFVTFHGSISRVLSLDRLLISDRGSSIVVNVKDCAECYDFEGDTDGREGICGASVGGRQKLPSGCGRNNTWGGSLNYFSGLPAVPGMDKFSSNVRIGNSERPIRVGDSVRIGGWVVSSEKDAGGSTGTTCVNNEGNMNGKSTIASGISTIPSETNADSDGKSTTSVNNANTTTVAVTSTTTPSNTKGTSKAPPFIHAHTLYRPLQVCNTSLMEEYRNIRKNIMAAPGTKGG